MAKRRIRHSKQQAAKRTDQKRDFERAALAEKFYGTIFGIPDQMDDGLHSALNLAAEKTRIGKKKLAYGLFTAGIVGSLAPVASEPEKLKVFAITHGLIAAAGFVLMRLASKTKKAVLWAAERGKSIQNEYFVRYARLAVAVYTVYNAIEFTINKTQLSIFHGITALGCTLGLYLVSHGTRDLESHLREKEEKK